MAEYKKSGGSATDVKSKSKPAKSLSKTSTKSESSSNAGAFKSREFISDSSSGPDSKFSYICHIYTRAVLIVYHTCIT